MVSARAECFQLKMPFGEKEQGGWERRERREMKKVNDPREIMTCINLKNLFRFVCGVCVCVYMSSCACVCVQTCVHRCMSV